MSKQSTSVAALVLAKLIEREKIKKPVRLEIKLLKLTNRLDPNGNQRRYFNVKLNDIEISQTIADLTGLHLSNAKDLSEPAVIIRGCGMDMALALQLDVKSKMNQEGYKDYIDSDYNFINN